MNEHFQCNLSPALKHSPLTQKRVRSPQQKCYLQHNECVCLHLEGGLENLRKRTETREKSLCNTSFQLRMGLKKGQKQGEMKEHKKTTLHRAAYRK